MKEIQNGNSVSQKKEIENSDLFFNKLTYFVLGGLITTPFLIYIIIKFRSVMFDSILLPYDTIWVPIVVGIFVAYNIQKITYQPFDDGRVTGIPFPIILWEPLSEGSDYWLDFYGPYTPISFFLNYVYFVLVSLAITLVVWYVIPVRMNNADTILYGFLAILVSISAVSLIKTFFDLGENCNGIYADDECIAVLDESDAEMFRCSDYSESDPGTVHGSENINVGDFVGGLDGSEEGGWFFLELIFGFLDV